MEKESGACMNGNKIVFDGNNPGALHTLMECENSKFPHYGKNENGEDIEIHISKTSIIYKTYQSNGWLRVNYYDENGLPNGETFEGRWKS